MTTPPLAASSADAPRPRRLSSAAAVVHESGLPIELASIILAVTGKCRLWNAERTDVARELCAHFRDGLEAGVSASDLAASFGDPIRAARLITGARRKLRPRWWRAMRSASRLLGGFLLICLALYAVLAARVFLYSPNISRNFMKELNAPLLQMPQSDRAWPLYIEAKKQFGPLPRFMLDSLDPDPRRPGDANWDPMVEWLDAHQDAMQLVRTAAARPSLGYIYRSNTDPDYGRALEITTPSYKFDPSIEPDIENPVMVGILLPHLGEMRRFARWLQADAHLAASRRDSDRFIADIAALFGLAEQALSEKFLISDLVGIAILELAFNTVVREAATPDLLSREQLRDLAHRVSAVADGRISIDASTELLGVEDILQRFYSDDGSGDGHYIGGPQTDQMYADFGLARPVGLPILKALQPVQSITMPSRAEVRELARAFVSAAAVDDALPPWRHNERTADAAYRTLMQSGLYAAMPILKSLQESDGPVGRSCAARDLTETQRDVALIVLALESSRRATGNWPAALTDLIPAYLRRLPLDPFTGKPLRYIPPASAESHPVLYSTGVDAVDDGGKAPDTREGRDAVRSFRWFGLPPTTQLPRGVDQQVFAISSGDWILWPPLAPVPTPPPLPDTNPKPENIQLN